MAKPILLCVDDDSDVLRAIERDLRFQYTTDYQFLGSDSPQGALDLLNELKVRSDSLALLLADQRMPRMDGVKFLQRAIEIFPGAKRALLTAYADTGAAISASTDIPTPWKEFLEKLDTLLEEPVRLDCIGGFAVVKAYFAKPHGQ